MLLIKVSTMKFAFRSADNCSPWTACSYMTQRTIKLMTPVVAVWLKFYLIKVMTKFMTSKEMKKLQKKEIKSNSDDKNSSNKETETADIKDPNENTWLNLPGVSGLTFSNKFSVLSTSPL